MELIVPDTSILILRKLSELIKQGKIKSAKILIPKAALDELQAQASRGRDVGFTGLEEIKELRRLAKTRKISIEFRGERPTLEEIQLAKKGRIDALIRDVAAKEKAVLYTADYVQALVAEAEGVEVFYVPPPVKKRVKLERYFTPLTQSVHLKVGMQPYAKIGKPGEVRLVQISKKKITEDKLKQIINEVVARARIEEDAFVEISKAGALVIQLGNYRIAISQPPFSDGLELTAVRPIAKVSLDDYKLASELKERLVNRSQGILIAGPPGSGKTSFASALAEFLWLKGKIVKTFEQPRDLQVGPEITQFAPLEGDWEKTSEHLLLVRPDYTIFDEIRRTKDFKVFADMRLAGVGMIGVVHATTPVSAIQRFIGRIELGMIPHIIDTVISIKNGKIEKVYELSLIVKIPSGMQEADLARPVVEIRDFATKQLEYEIYTYGSENVIVPVKRKLTASQQFLLEKIKKDLSRFDPDVGIEFIGENAIVAKVKSNVISRLIGRKGKSIEKIEKKFGIRISVEPREQTLKKEIEWEYEESGNYIVLKFSKKLIGKQIDIYDGDHYLFSPFVGNKGLVKIRKRTDIGKALLRAIASKKLKVFG